MWVDAILGYPQSERAAAFTIVTLSIGIDLLQDHHRAWVRQIDQAVDDAESANEPRREVARAFLHTLAAAGWQAQGRQQATCALQRRREALRRAWALWEPLDARKVQERYADRS